MPQFAIVTPTKTRPLGEFTSIDEVKKLRFIKDNPSFEQYIQEIPQKVKEPKRSNRWRVVFYNLYNDLTTYYTREEVEQFLRDCHLTTKYTLIHVPKYAYHESDGPII